MNNYKSLAAGATIGAVILGIIIGAIIKQRTKRLPIPLPPNPKDKKKQYNIYNAIGGSVGRNDGKIENCASSGKVIVKGAPIPIEAGGFVGNNNGRICGSKFVGNRVYLSTGKLYKDDCCGGFAGKNSIGGVIDGCEVGEVNVETNSNVKRLKSGAVIVETTNKTKGGGVVGVAGKRSVTMNCTYNARRKTKIGEFGVNSFYKKERQAILKNNKEY